MTFEERRKFYAKKRSLRYTSNDKFLKNKRPYPLPETIKEEPPIVLVSSDSNSSESEMTLSPKLSNDEINPKVNDAQMISTNSIENKAPEVINSSSVD